MSDIEKDSTGLPQPPSNEGSSDEAALRERQERLANEMAGAAKKVERQYDEEHDIFTK